MTVPSPSKYILQGLEKFGIGVVDAARIIGVTPARIEKILQKKANLTSAQRRAIEMATGKTTGQLAASVLDTPDGPLSKLMDSWAKAVPPAAKRQRRSTVSAVTAKRKATRKLATAHV